MTNSTKNICYFISDAHLGIDLPGFEKREQNLIEFFRTITPTAQKLFIVGDLFDFWVEYKHAIRPEYFPILHAMAALMETGTEIHYLAGNHDFALGSFLTDTMGIIVHPDMCETVEQGKKICLYHGDGLLKDDVGYRFLRKVLRNKLGQRIYKMLHPDIGVPLGSGFSGSSRRFLGFRIKKHHLAEYRDHAHEMLDKSNCDIVVFGHTHWAEIVRFGDKIYCNTGEWIRRYNYAKLESGNLTLWTYHPDSPPTEILEGQEPPQAAS